MEKFINNHQFNQIRRLMLDLHSTLKFNADQMIVAAAKDIANDEIKAMLSMLAEEYSQLVDIATITKPEDVEDYIRKISDYVVKMRPVTESQIQKLFRKEKKLKTPAILECAGKSYIGWIDQGKRKLYIVYWLEDKLMGMICSIKETEVSNARMCSICGHMNDNNEVVNVSAKCKTKSADQFHEIGFNICKDSDECNKRITDVMPLEKLLKKVNGIKVD